MPENADVPAAIHSDGLYSSQYPQVIFEEEDHEIVVVNLLEGTYYYLTGTAAFVWMGLHAGLTIDDLTRCVSDYTDVPESFAGEMEAFVRQLMSLALVSPVPALPGEALPSPIVSDFLGATYESPVIETYSDLQDILLLDPVHDVDESGWPTPRKP